MSHLFDQYLLFRIRTKRDPDAFARLYDRYVTSIYRFVLLKVPSKEIAEDLTSEAFLKCLQYLQTQPNVKNIRALLYRIARNLVVDYYRKTEQTPTFSLEFVTNDLSEPSSLVGTDVSDEA